MKFILKTYFDTTAKEVYETWLTSEGHTKMTGGPADISDKIEFAIRESSGLIKNDDLINQEENPEAAEVDTKEALEAK